MQVQPTCEAAVAANCWRLDRLQVQEKSASLSSGSWPSGMLSSTLDSRRSRRILWLRWQKSTFHSVCKRQRVLRVVGHQEQRIGNSNRGQVLSMRHHAALDGCRHTDGSRVQGAGNIWLLLNQCEVRVNLLFTAPPSSMQLIRGSPQ